MLYLSWILAAASLPSPEHHLTSVGELKRAVASVGLKYRHFAPNEQCVSKQEEAMERGREGFSRDMSGWWLLMEV